jgi:hypothetical protein
MSPEDRRWTRVAGGVVAGLLLLGAAWALGDVRARTLAGDARRDADASRPLLVRTVAGVPVGASRSRAGALAAADNYVAIATETIVQDPPRYERLVRGVYAPGYRATALREGARAREVTPASLTNYAAGGRTVVVVAARRLEAYDGAQARVTSWIAGITWGPERAPGHTWLLVTSRLRWQGQRWLVERVEQAERPAPAPRRLGYSNEASLQSTTFERELRGMTAPIYGG